MDNVDQAETGNNTATIDMPEASLDSTKLTTQPIQPVSFDQIKAMCKLLLIVNLRMPFVSWTKCNMLIMFM